MKSKSEKSFSHEFPKRKSRNPSLFTAALIVLLLCLASIVKIFSNSATAKTAPFVFTAAADHGRSSDTKATLNSIAALAPVFYLALGDLSYTSSEPESNWCNLVKYKDYPTNTIKRFSADFPFQLVVGNHENSPTGD